MEYIISVTEATNSHSSEDRRFFLGALYQAEALKPSAAISPGRCPQGKRDEQISCSKKAVLYTSPYPSSIFYCLVPA